MRQLPVRLGAIASLVTAAGLGLAGCHQAADSGGGTTPDPVALIRTQPVAASTIRERLEAPGTVQVLAERQASVMPTASARITAIRVVLGDRVKSGQLIATLVPDPTVRADALKARAAFELAQQELQRQERLVAGGVSPRAQLDQARAAHASAQADWTARAEAYRLAQSNTTLRAPRAGVITQLNGAVGQTADTATPIALITNLDELAVEAELPADKVTRVRPGETVSVLVPGGKPLSGRVRNVQGAVDPATQRARVLVTAHNPQAALKPGMFTTVVFALGAHRGVLVPAKAVVPRESGSVVYVVTGGVAHERKITSRPGPDPAQVEVISGLRGGEVVATEGAYELADGMHVREGH